MKFRCEISFLIAIACNARDYEKEDELLKFIRIFENYSQNATIFPKGHQCGYKFPQQSRLKLFDFSKLAYFNVVTHDFFKHNFQAVLISTACFTNHSFGNDFGFYIESYLCSLQIGANFVAPSFVSPISALSNNHLFFLGLPKIRVETNEKRFDEARNLSVSICKSIMFPWEQEDALLHTHIEIVRTIFRGAIDSCLNSTKPTYSKLKILDDDRVQSSGQVALDFDSNKILFPFVPNISIHYRCGDNTDIGGLLPFHAINNIIISYLENHKYLLLPHNNNNNSNNINNNSIKNNKNITLYILTEGPTKHMQSVSEAQRKRCDDIRNLLYHHIISSFPSMTVILLRGHDFFEDIVRMTYSNLLICSASTFCLWPAISTYGTAYLPVSKLFMKGKTKFYGPRIFWITDTPLVYMNPKRSNRDIDWANIIQTLTYVNKSL